MQLTRALLTLVAVSTGACGSPNSPGSPPWTEPLEPLPVSHRLASAVSATFSAGGNYGFSFSLPSRASVTFQANQTTNDTWTVAIFTPQQWTDYRSGISNQAYAGVHNNVMQVSDSTVLPPGDWYLGFHCNNVIERCMLVFDIQATY